MKKLLSAAALLALTASVAYAQLDLHVDNREPMTKLDGPTWTTMIKRFVNAKPIIGVDAVYMVNPTADVIGAVNCGKWQLVGSKPYITGNPTELPPWSVTYVGTHGFDGYCKNGVDGTTTGGDVRHGLLNAADGTFSGSTFIVFRGS